MATTSSTLAAGKATTSQSGNGKSGKGRTVAAVATAALGLSLVVGGLLGHSRQSNQAAVPQVSFAPDTHIATMWDFREDSRSESLAVPDPFLYREDRRGEAVAVQPVSGVSSDPFLYREDHRSAASTIDFGLIDFGPVECGAAPCVSAPAFAPDQFTYREDRRVESTTPAWSPDFWTYREDHRSR